MAIVLTDLGTQVKHEGNLLESIEHYKQVCFFYDIKKIRRIIH